MVCSMTGFGRSTKERDGRTVMVEIKTVNHRFLEISIRQPKQFSVFEDKLKKFMQEFKEFALNLFLHADIWDNSY